MKKRKIKLMEEKLMKKSQGDEDEDYMFLISPLLSIKKKFERHSSTGTQNVISKQGNQKNSNF
jgi:hypothetical protein